MREAKFRPFCMRMRGQNQTNILKQQQFCQLSKLWHTYMYTFTKIKHKYTYENIIFIDTIDFYNNQIKKAKMSLSIYLLIYNNDLFS